MPPGGLFLPDPVDLGESSAPARVRCGAIIRAVFADQSTPGIALSLLPAYLKQNKDDNNW